MLEAVAHQPTARRRVVITGVGVVSPLGLDPEDHFDRLCRGESAVELIEGPAFESFPYRLKSSVDGFDPKEKIRHRMLRKLLPPSAQYAVDAGGQALNASGLVDGDFPLGECGVFAGSVQLEIDAQMLDDALRASVSSGGRLDMRRFATRGLANLDPLFLIKALPNSGLCGIAIEHGATGYNLNISDGPTSGLLAVSMAAGAVADGTLAVAVAGGYDSLLHLDDLMGHLIKGRLSLRRREPQGACRPFDRRRDGYALGEGAAFFLLEDSEHAIARGAVIHAELLASSEAAGGGVSDHESLARCAQTALHDADLRPSEIALCFGDGVATDLDDLLEARAAHSLFGSSETLFTAATGAVGFTGTAGGCLSLANAVLALRHGVAPPTINCDDPDPRCALRCALEPTPLEPGARALVWTTDQGRKNAAVVAGAFEPTA